MPGRVFLPLDPRLHLLVPFRRATLFTAEVLFISSETKFLGKVSLDPPEPDGSTGTAIGGSQVSPELLTGAAQMESGTTSNRRGPIEAEQGGAGQPSGHTGLPNQYSTSTCRRYG